MVDPQVTMGFNTKMLIHDLDDLGFGVTCTRMTSLLIYGCFLEDSCMIYGG